MMSPHVEAVVMKALEKRPEMRYPTMDEFIRAMTDPVGYVEANGGIGGFLSRQLMPSTAPLPALNIKTPAPTGMMLSPVPGTLASPVPTTLGAASGQPGTMHPAAGRNKMGFIIGGGLVVVAAAVGVFFVLSGKKTSEAAKGDGSAISMPSGSAAVTPPVPDPKPEPKPEPKVVTPPPPPPDPNAHVTINTTPQGADILLDDVSVNKKTPATLDIPKGKSPKIKLHLAGYDDFTLPSATFEKDLTEDIPLVQTKKVVVPTGGQQHTGGTTHTGGNGSNSGGKKTGGGTKQGGTGLMRPEDM
jgi:hypothetical protein